LVFAELMRWAAVVAAAVAFLRRDGLNAPWMTGWDQAAAFLFLGYLGRFQVEPEAVRAAVAALEASAGAA
jgi:hypothetical protein